jgi:hypothetical protein
MAKTAAVSLKFQTCGVKFGPMILFRASELFLINKLAVIDRLNSILLL